MADSFYIFFPSDGCMDIYPNNKPHHFTITLPSDLIFHNTDWEVALTNISFVNSIKLFTNHESLELSIKDSTAFQANDEIAILPIGEQPIEFLHIQDVQKAFLYYFPALNRFYIRKSITFLHSMDIALDIKTATLLGFVSPELSRVEEKLWIVDFYSSDHLTEEEKAAIRSVDTDWNLNPASQHIFMAPFPPLSTTIMNDPQNPIKLLLGKKDKRSGIIDMIPGYYSSIEAIIQMINGEIKKKTANVPDVFYYDSNSAKVYIRLPHRMKLLFYHSLNNILGFEKNSYHSHQMASMLPILHGGVYSLYVYCNIIKEQRVGAEKYPLLRTLPLNLAKRGQMVSYDFDDRRYCRIKSNMINTIEFEIRDDSGGIVHFGEGKAMIILHFQQV